MLFIICYEIEGNALEEKEVTAVKGVYYSDDVLFWFEQVVSLQLGNIFSIRAVSCWTVSQCVCRLCSLDFGSVLCLFRVG